MLGDGIRALVRSLRGSRFEWSLIIPVGGVIQVVDLKEFGDVFHGADLISVQRVTIVSSSRKSQYEQHI